MAVRGSAGRPHVLAHPSLVTRARPQVVHGCPPPPGFGSRVQRLVQLCVTNRAVTKTSAFVEPISLNMETRGERAHAPAAEPPTWACDVCTFLNSGYIATCEMCDTPCAKRRALPHPFPVEEEASSTEITEPFEAGPSRPFADPPRHTRDHLNEAELRAFARDGYIILRGVVIIRHHHHTSDEVSRGHSYTVDFHPVNQP